MIIIFTWWACLITLVWAAAVFAVKMLFRKLGEEIKHYRAAHVTLLFGMPYRRKRKQAQETLAAEG